MLLDVVQNILTSCFKDAVVSLDFNFNVLILELLVSCKVDCKDSSRLVDVHDVKQVSIELLVVVVDCVLKREVAWVVDVIRQVHGGDWSDVSFNVEVELTVCPLNCFIVSANVVWNWTSCKLFPEHGVVCLRSALALSIVFWVDVAVVDVPVACVRNLVQLVLSELTIALSVSACAGACAHSVAIWVEPERSYLNKLLILLVLVAHEALWHQVDRWLDNMPERVELEITGVNKIAHSFLLDDQSLWNQVAIGGHGLVTVLLGVLVGQFALIEVLVIGASLGKILRKYSCGVVVIITINVPIVFIDVLESLIFVCCVRQPEPVDSVR